MQNLSIKEAYTLIDEVSDKHFNQLVSFNKKSVVFSCTVCLSFIFGSIPIKLLGYNFVNIIFNHRLGILIPWLIVGAFYLLQSRSLFNMNMNLKPIDGLYEKISDKNVKKEIKLKINGYLLQKLRNQPSVYNPFSIDYIGLVLTNAPLFLISCLTSFLYIFRFLYQAFYKIANSPEGFNLSDSLTYIDLIHFAVTSFLILPYFLFLVILFIGIFEVNDLESSNSRTRMKYSDRPFKVLSISAIISVFGAPFIGSFLATLIFFLLPLIFPK